jgi:hypothetical protein
MCIMTVKEIIKKGYKVGELVNGKFSAYQDPMLINIWLTSNFIPLSSYEDKKEYISGFHIFTNKKDAKRYLAYLHKHYESFAYKWQLFECEYSGVLAEGTEKMIYADKDPYIKTIVAARMKIIHNPTV